MADWLKRVLPSLLLDAVLVVAIALPDIAVYARWPLAALYAVVSWGLLKDVSANRWIVTILRDPATRLSHGLEHATLALCTESGIPVTHGFTHGRDRFVVALQADNGHHLVGVRDAATDGIRRILAGERSLAYHAGCGTSEVVSSAALWIAYVITLVSCFLVGVSMFLALSLIAFRFWMACETALGLLAQRRFTVSTDFISARVVDVQEVVKVRGMVRPADETWFEVRVEVHGTVTQGGVVSPGTL